MTSGAEGGLSGAGGRTAGPDAARGDGEGALQEELRREAAERDALGGDTAMDRTLTGSSTWVTLGDTIDPPVGGRPDVVDYPGGPPAP